MRWLPWGKSEKEAAAQPTEYDRWLDYARWGAVVLSIALALLSIVPPVMQATEPNQGADINITFEFYTAFDGGGGYIAWDFAGSAARDARALVDALGDSDGHVVDSEFLSYSNVVDSRLTGSVMRHFEILAVRIVEQAGFVGHAVNSSDPAHFKMIINGQWVKRDGDVTLSRDGALTAAVPNITAATNVRDRTIIVAGGFSSFVSTSLAAHSVRVPGGSAVVSVDEYQGDELNQSQPADLRFERFSVVNSNLILLAPLAIAYLLGVRGPRLEQEAARQRRIVPFHGALAALLWLLIVAYFAGVPGIVVWVAGAGLGAVGMWMAYQFYPSDVPFDSLERPVGAKPDRPGKGGRTATAEEALAMMGAAHGPVGAASAAPPNAQATARDALAMLDAAHGPLEPAAETEAPPGAAGRAQVGSQPLALPDDETQRPGGRARAPPAPGSRPAAPAAPAAPPKPAAPAAPEVPRSVIRCPGCRHQFEAVGRRPLPVTCPHCGRKGLLR